MNVIFCWTLEMGSTNLRSLNAKLPSNVLVSKDAGQQFLFVSRSRLTACRWNGVAISTRSLGPIWYCRCTCGLQAVNRKHIPVSLNDMEGMMTTANPRFHQNSSGVAGCDSHKINLLQLLISSQDLQAVNQLVSEALRGNEAGVFLNYKYMPSWQCGITIYPILRLIVLIVFPAIWPSNGNYWNPNLWQLLTSVLEFIAIFLDDIHCIPMIPQFLVGAVTTCDDKILMVDA